MCKYACTIMIALLAMQSVALATDPAWPSKSGPHADGDQAKPLFMDGGSVQKELYPQTDIRPEMAPAFVLTESVTTDLYDPDIGDVILEGNDDGSTEEIVLPFAVSVYGRTFTSFWINNNGNVTFTGALSTFTAFAFPNDFGTVIVAPFFADVDTRPGASGKVHYKALDDRVVITWNGVGYYSGQTDKLNTFQIILTRSGLFGFSYADMEWTTGSASGGQNGFGGSPARIGFDAGDGVNAVVHWEGNTAVSLADIAHSTFWYTSRTGEPGQDVAFIKSPRISGEIMVGDTLRLAAEGGLGQYLWDFGDGRTSSLRSPGLVAFGTEGELEVVLDVTDVWGEHYQDTRTLIVVPDPGAAPDLDVVVVNVPPELAIGQAVNITYTVRNAGNATVTDVTWTDAIYLSRDEYLDTTDTRLASVPVSHELGPGQTYLGVMTVTLPPMVEGVYYLILSADDEWQVLERYQLNNEFEVATDLAIPLLEEGVDRAASFPAGRVSHYYRIHAPSGGGSLLLSLDSSVAGLQLYARFGALPTRGVYDYQMQNSQLLIPAATSGTWYVLAYGDAMDQAGQYTIGYDRIELKLLDVWPRQHGTAGPLHLTLSGTGFLQPMQAALIGLDDTPYFAEAVEVNSFTRITARFAAGAVPAGIYTVRVARPADESDELPGAFEMIAGGEARLWTNLIVPRSLGRSASATIFVEYANTGELAMPAPLLVLGPRDPASTNQPLISLDQTQVATGFWSSSGVPQGFSNSVQFLAVGENPGLLQPGESGRVPVYFIGLQRPWDFSNTRIGFALGVLTAEDQTPADWSAMKVGMRPSYVREDAWDAVWSNFMDTVGFTWGDYVALLGRNAVYLYQQGQRVADIDQLLAFAFRQADALSPIPVLASDTNAQVEAPGLSILFERRYAQPISRRYEYGPMGRGWAHNWQYRLEVRGDGTVVVTDMTGTPRIFEPDSRAGRPYLAQPGDQGVLRAVPGEGFLLTEADGLVRAFSIDGKLDYVEDTNGNRITCTHAGDLLTHLAHSSGQGLAIAYNSGLISSITDDHGRQTQFTYDGEHLVSVRAHDGRVTTYAYSTGQGPANEHALTQIGLPDGTHRRFAYDDSGRLASVHRDGVEPVTFSYESAGTVVTTDGLGHASRSYFDNWGRTVRTEDPLGNAMHFRFDDFGNLVTVTDPAGMPSTFEYDRRGNLIRATDALRQVSRFAYSQPYNRLARFTDANNNRTVYNHDTGGNVTSITDANGAAEILDYDAHGNLITRTNGRGEPISYTHDTSGRVTSKVFADSSRADYVYDTRGNLVEATSTYGTTTFAYDANDYLTLVGYPGGRGLSFTYDAAGRRASSLDQTGRRLNYHYDDAGRLERMTDQADNEIVRYGYDAAGRLGRKTVGSGAYTDYAYDAAGRLISLVNRAPDDTVLSRFDYTYDRLGRRTTMTTVYGSWTYGYDDIGQLTHATLQATDSEIPDQDIRYVYDGMGNRIRATVDGVEEEYSVNELNQYTQVGDRTYTFDADGNLTGESGPDGTTVYTYESENRLVAITRGAHSWQLAYDAMGNRVAVTDNGTVSHYLIDPVGMGNVVSQYDGSDGLLAHFDHGLGLISRIDHQGATAYYAFDAMGNTSGMVDPSGALLNRYAYAPFGDALSQAEAVANPFRYGGEVGVMHDAAGVHLMRARYYHALTGRFMSRDPVGLWMGGFNPYGYASNNPIIFYDPSGEKWSCGWLWGGDFSHSVGISLGYSHGVSVGGTASAGVGAGWSVGPSAWLGPSAEVGLNAGGASVGLGGVGAGGTIGAGFSGFAGGSVGLNVGYSYGQGWGLFCGWSSDSPAPQEVPTETETEDDTNVAEAVDPNEKSGPGGFGDGNYVAAGSSLAYRVDFENLESATAPARIVTVTDALSSSFDWATFELTQIGFGDELIIVPPGRDYFEAVVPYSFNDIDFEVHIQAGIDTGTGEAFAFFYSIDPETGLTPPVGIGFLPPEDGSGRGRGHFSYVIRHDPGLPSGTEIRNVASIQFDFGLTIATNQVDPLNPSQGTDPDKEALVTIDAGPPTSRVRALPSVTPGTFQVAWTGEDDAGGSGIGGHDIYVQDNGGVWTLWQGNTTRTSATFTGQNGHTYAFYSIAIDNVGHREDKPAQFEARTTVRVTSSSPPPSPPAPDCVEDVDCDDGDLCTTNACANGVCVDEPVDCGEGFCDPATGACVECWADADCGEGQECEPASGTCVDKVPPDAGEPIPDPDEPSDEPSDAPRRHPLFPWCGMGVVEAMMVSVLGLTLMRAHRRRRT